MSPDGFNWTDFSLNVIVLAIIPGFVALFGGIAAADGLTDKPKRRRIKLWFWGLCIVGVAMTSVQQYRVILADQGKPFGLINAFKQAFPWFKPAQETATKPQEPVRVLHRFGSQQNPASPSNDELRMRTRNVTDRLTNMVNDYKTKMTHVESLLMTGDKETTRKSLAVETELKSHFANDAENRELFAEANCLDEIISVRLGMPVSIVRKFSAADWSGIALLHEIAVLRDLASKLPL